MTATQDSILETALDLILREGVGALTLDRVARQAGVSKGGLLYHYPGKEELISGLIEHLIDALDRKRQELESGNTPGTRTRAFVRAAAGVDMAPALLAAQAAGPSLIDPLREHYRQWQDRLNHDGIDPTRATVARLAAEGLWFSEALDLAPPPHESREAIVREILALTEPGPGITTESIKSSEVPQGPAGAGDLHNNSGQLREAARESAAALLRLQHPLGYWRGDLTADTTLESDFILLSLWLSRMSEPRIGKALRRILDQQLPDGGWNIYPAGPAEVNATIRAYVALKLGGHNPGAPEMKRARECALSLGGLQATNSYTKINLSLFGLFPRQFAPSVPPELVFMPRNLLYEMSSWTRAIVIPLSIVQATGVQRPAPKGFTIEELYLPNTKLVLPKKDRLSTVFIQADKVLKLWERRGPKDLRAKAIREAEKWMLDHMRFSDGIGAIYPSMMYAIMAMDVLGYEKDHPDFVEGLRQFEDLIMESEDRLQFQPAVSPVWDTAIAMFALGELGSPDQAAMRRAADWLLDKEVRRKGDWAIKKPELQPGGWAFEFANDFYPDIDDTAMVLLALQHAKASDAERQVRAERRAVQWLLGMQSSDGGWAAFDFDNNWQLLNKVPFADHNAMLDPTCPDITGRVMEALCRRGYSHENQSIARGVQYLLTHQKDDGSWYGRWGVNYIYGTFLALRGLRASGSPAIRDAVQKAANWLRDIQNPDGGWGESCASYEVHKYVRAFSTASQTAWALLGLEAAGDQGSAAVQRGIEWLLEHRNGRGWWDENLATGTGFPNVFYLTYHLYRHYFPLLALAVWQRKLETAN